MKVLLTFSMAMVLVIGSCKNKEAENSTDMEALSLPEVSQNSIEEERYFALWAMGNEPFWSLKVEEDGILLVHNGDSIRTPAVQPIIDEEHGMSSYTIETEATQMNIAVTPGPCNDTMSDAVYSYQVQVNYKASGDSSAIQLNGCGGYSLEEGLVGKWQLTTLMGKAITGDDFGREIPSLEFQQLNRGFSGSTGCNRMMGQFYYSPSFIGFQKIMTTKALCGKGQENEDAFMQQLNAVDDYSLSGDVLIWLSEGNEVMQFQRSLGE